MVQQQLMCEHLLHRTAERDTQGLRPHAKQQQQQYRLRIATQEDITVCNKHLSASPLPPSKGQSWSEPFNKSSGPKHARCVSQPTCYISRTAAAVHQMRKTNVFLLCFFCNFNPPKLHFIYSRAAILTKVYTNSTYLLPLSKPNKPGETAPSQRRDPASSFRSLNLARIADFSFLLRSFCGAKEV